jgi:hypothetical protein
LQTRTSFREFIRFFLGKGLAGCSFALLLNFWAVNSMMNKQPILDELHAVREQLLAESGGTLSGLFGQPSGRTLQILQNDPENSAHTWQ